MAGRIDLHVSWINTIVADKISTFGEQVREAIANRASANAEFALAA